MTRPVRNAPDDPDSTGGPGGIEVGQLFGAAVKPWSVPVFVGAFGAGVLAWVAGTDGRILLLIVAGVAGVLIATDRLRARIARRSMPPPPWLILTPVIAADLIAAFFALAYRGIDGGMWFALTMNSTVAGQSLERKWALAAGAFGGVLIVVIALASGQFDLLRSPVIFAASIYVFAMAGLANAQRTAVIDLSDTAYRERISMLETHNRQVEALIGSLHDGLLTTDADGRVERWNQALETMTGMSAGEAAGAHVTHVLRLSDADGELRDDDHPCVAARRGPISAGSPIGEPERDLFLLTDENLRVPVTVSAAPYPVDHSSHGVVAVVNDVTRERGISDMRDSLISLVSHELKTPLTMTVGFAELLADGAVTGEDARQSAIQIRDATIRLSSMIEDLLTTAVIEAGELKLIIEEVPVDDLLSVVVARVADTGHDIDVEVESDLNVAGDPDRLEHVFGNLLGNALKYSPEGTAVKISGRRDGGGVIVEIADRGIGISPEDAERIFERFSRSASEEVQRLPGTGLGLFIAEKVVEAHGGRVDLASTPGEGTTFTVHLPSWDHRS